MSKNKNNYYRPSDDTFLLAECVQKFKGESALEIAAGSGYISNVLKENFRLVIATDIDLDATRAARNKANLLVCCDSASAITNTMFDLVVINPPYLPSQQINDITVDGGRDGIEVSLKMLCDAVRLLKNDGVILLVTSSLANYTSLLTHMQKLGFKADIIGRKKLDFEELFVIQARR
ncbi:MAG: HemK2/MTQ2 family protein methyltransferase [Nitrososphaerales archaeon]